jgi:hypothetical protein
LLAALLFCGHAAIAATQSLETAIAGELTPSAMPSLLGPITSGGRVGWECKPERAAGASGWREAELPRDSGNP